MAYLKRVPRDVPGRLFKRGDLITAGKRDFAPPPPPLFQVSLENWDTVALTGDFVTNRLSEGVVEWCVTDVFDEPDRGDGSGWDAPFLEGGTIPVGAEGIQGVIPSTSLGVVRLHMYQNIAPDDQSVIVRQIYEGEDDGGGPLTVHAVHPDVMAEFTPGNSAVSGVIPVADGRSLILALSMRYTQSSGHPDQLTLAHRPAGGGTETPIDRLISAGGQNAAGVWLSNPIPGGGDVEIAATTSGVNWDSIYLCAYEVSDVTTWELGPVFNPSANGDATFAYPAPGAEAILFHAGGSQAYSNLTNAAIQDVDFVDRGGVSGGADAHVVNASRTLVNDGVAHSQRTWCNRFTAHHATGVYFHTGV